MKNVVVFFLLALPFYGEAQQCVEPGRIQPQFPCNRPRYEPVCGCDGVTYRNECDAYWHAGVNYWDYGVCYGAGIDVYPNPVMHNDPLNLTIQFPELENHNVTLYVVDSYGKVQLQRFFNKSNRVEYSMPTYNLPLGVYVILVTTSSGVYEYIKFIKA